MGGGIRKVAEVRKSVNLSPRESVDRREGEGGAAGLGEPELSLCEQTQTVAFRFSTDAHVPVGATIRVVAASPPAVVLGQYTVGYLSERRQAQTLAACLSAGFMVFGEVVASDSDLGEGLASVAGTRSRE